MGEVKWGGVIECAAKKLGVPFTGVWPTVQRALLGAGSDFEDQFNAVFRALNEFSAMQDWSAMVAESGGDE